MAPTEILATQHYATLQKFFAGTNTRLCLLTGACTAKEKRQIKADLLEGNIPHCGSTHALIQNDVEFANLGLVITDEQHRFGVQQRADLAMKGEEVHTLVMSATPIPRTLAMMIYGDLDISVLDELPPGGRRSAPMWSPPPTTPGSFAFCVRRWIGASRAISSARW